MRLPARPLAILILALASTAASAQKPDAITAGEMARLPVYCPDTQGFNYGDKYYNTSPRAAYWVSFMGETFWAFHHYCWGMIRMYRSQTPGMLPVLKEGWLKGAIGDFEYVLRFSTPRFIMLPEVYLRIGEAYVALKNFALAEEAFANSRAAKADYWPPYVRWAESLVNQKRTKEAKAHLEDGLRIMPREKILLDEYRKLGGDPDAFVKSLPPPPPAAAAADDAASAAAAAPSAAPAASAAQ